MIKLLTMFAMGYLFCYYISKLNKKWNEQKPPKEKMRSRAVIEYRIKDLENQLANNDGLSYYVKGRYITIIEELKWVLGE